MVRKWKLGATGSAILASAFVIVACSSKSDDDSNNGGSGGKGASGGTGGTAGKGGTGGSGGAATGGTGGSTTGGTGGSTTGGSGGATTGGSGGAATGGTAGSAAGAGGGAAAMGPYECKGSVATCDTFSDFGTGTAAWWGDATFNGGFSVFSNSPSMLTEDTSTATVPSIHITGMVGGYGAGFNFWFTTCSDLSAYTGVMFTMKGTTGYATTMNAFDFQPQTNSDYPWQPRPQDNKGGCTSPTPTNPWGDCVAPTKHMTTMDTPQTVLWTDADLANGKPTPFSAAGAKELVGLQFQFPWAEGATAYAVDVTLDDVSFVGGTGKSCGTMVSGGGGMGAGGMSGAGGAAAGGGGMSAGGMAGAATGGMGGAATGGMAGSTSGGMGGVSAGGMGGVGAGMGGKANGGKAGG